MSSQRNVRYHQVQESSVSHNPAVQGIEMSNYQIPRKQLPSTSISKSPFHEPHTVERTGDVSDEERRSQPATSESTGWTPFYLRTPVLTCFVLLFLAIIVVLQVLLSISNSHQGIATTRNNLHYLWTYGPTAFLVIVTYLWRQVDYQAKQVQPWSELAKGSAAGSHGLLIDYHTPFFLVAFKDALKKKHFAVASTIVVSVLIKALTVISTGLMDLEAVKIAGQPTDMITHKVFDGSAFAQRPYVDYQAAYEVLCNLNYNLTFDPGLTAQEVIQPFVPASGPSSSMTTFTADVDVLRAEVTCETANATFITHAGTTWNTYANISYTTSDCHLPAKMLPPPNADSNYTCRVNSTDSSVFVWTWTGTCTNLGANDQGRDRVGFVAYVCKPQGLAVTGTLCLPSYSIRPARVSLDSFGNVLDVTWDSKAEPRQLPGVKPIDLVTKVFGQDDPNTQLQLTPYFTELMGSLQGSVDQLTILALTTGSDVDRTTLADPQYLASRMNEVIPRLGSQVANIYLLQNSTSSEPVAGSIDHVELRLMVRSLPVRLMQSICAVCIILVLLVMLKVTRNIAPSSIMTIGGVATILARSPRVTTIFRGSGASTLDSIRAVVSGLHFGTATKDEDNSRTFLLKVSDSETPSPTWSVPSKIHWEQSVALRWWVISFTSIVCLAVLVALEVLLSQSQRRGGIASVDAESALRYTWLYIPTAILISISMMFGVISFNIEFAHPYYELALGFTSPYSSLFWNPAGDSSLRTAWRAFRNSKFALAFSFIAVLIAPLLTIVASSLFSIQYIPSYTRLSLQSQDWFNVPKNIDGDVTVAGLVTQTNITFPNGTYDEVVFPSINPHGIDGRSGNLSIIVPALRSRLECHSISSQDIANLTLVNSTLQGRITVPYNCGYEDPPNYVDLFDLVFKNMSSDSYFGDFINFYDYLDLYETSWCATPYFTFYGHVTNNKIDHLQAYLCSAGLDVLNTNITLSVPGLSIVQKPIPDESSVRNFSSWSERGMFPSLWDNYGNINASFRHAYLSLAVAGRDGISAQQLEDPAVFLKQLQHVYRQYTAQVINYVYRDTNATTNTTLLNGVQLTNLPSIYINADTPRLVQSPISTRILDAILGLLFICGIVILFTFNGTRIMPKPMGSLAAIISLLADSRIVDNLNEDLTPPGSEWLDHKENRKRGLWKNEEFCMRWWDARDRDREQGAPLLTPTSPATTVSVIGTEERGERRFGIDSRVKKGLM